MNTLFFVVSQTGDRGRGHKTCPWLSYDSIRGVIYTGMKGRQRCFTTYLSFFQAPSYQMPGDHFTQASHLVYCAYLRTAALFYYTLAKLRQDKVRMGTCSDGYFFPYSVRVEKALLLIGVDVLGCEVLAGLLRFDRNLLLCGMRLRKP